MKKEKWNTENRIWNTEHDNHRQERDILKTGYFLNLLLFECGTTTTKKEEKKKKRQTIKILQHCLHAHTEIKITVVQCIRTCSIWLRARKRKDIFSASQFLFIINYGLRAIDKQNGVHVLFPERSMHGRLLQFLVPSFFPSLFFLLSWSLNVHWRYCWCFFFLPSVIDGSVFLFTICLSIMRSVEIKITPSHWWHLQYPLSFSISVSVFSMDLWKRTK